MSTLPPSDRLSAHVGTLPDADLTPSEAVRLVRIQGLAGVGTWEYDRRSHRTTLSPSLREMMGLQRDEAFDYRMWVHPEDLPALDAMRERSLQEPGCYRLEHRMLLRSGEPMHVQSACQAFADNEGYVFRIVGAVLDITDRKQVEKALQISEERWKLALRGSNEGVWDWDLRTNEFFISQHLSQTLGFTSTGDGARFDNWSQYIHPEDRARTMRCLAEHLEGRTSSYRVEHRIRHRDGSYRWLIARGSAVRDELGKAYRLVGVSSDITDHRLMEQTLREREDLLKAAVEGSFDSFFILRAIRDHDGRIEDFEFIDLNHRACQYAGRPREELIGRGLLDVFAFPSSRKQFERYARVCETRIPLDEEFLYSSERLPGIWLHQQVIPVRDGVAVTIADITERKSAEQAIRENQRLVERIAASVPEFICIFDLDSRRSVYRNRSILRSLDYLQEDPPMLDLMTLMRILHPEDLPLLEAHYAEVRSAKHDEPIQVQLRMMDGRGEEQWFLIRSMVFQRDESGRPVQALASAQHITEIKRYEIRLKEQMLQLQAARAELEARQVDLERLNERLAALASRDGLTDVYNHRAFQDRLAEEVSRAQRQSQPLSLLMTDVDDFKAYNDRYGHPAGDERLKEFAQALVKAVRTIDFVARYGGEEFAIILPNTRVEEAEAIALRILDTLREAKGSDYMTASFGCAELDHWHGGEAQLIRDADGALYRAKSNGKNQVQVVVPKTNA